MQIVTKIDESVSECFLNNSKRLVSPLGFSDIQFNDARSGSCDFGVRGFAFALAFPARGGELGLETRAYRSGRLQLVLREQVVLLNPYLQILVNPVGVHSHQEYLYQGRLVGAVGSSGQCKGPLKVIGKGLAFCPLEEVSDR